MKKIMLALLLLLVCKVVTSQESFSLDVLVDPKLAMMTDDYGNSPLTLNSLVNASVQFEQRDFGYYFLGQSLEYADLHGGTYIRYSILQFGYTFNRLPFSDRIESSVALNYGIVKRWSFDFANFGGILDLAYCISERFKLTCLMQVVRRTDIESPTDDPTIYRASFFVGFKFNFSKRNGFY